MMMKATRMNAMRPAPQTPRGEAAREGWRALKSEAVSLSFG